MSCSRTQGSEGSEAPTLALELSTTTEPLISVFVLVGEFTVHACLASDIKLSLLIVMIECKTLILSAFCSFKDRKNVKLLTYMD